MPMLVKEKIERLSLLEMSLFGFLLITEACFPSNPFVGRMLKAPLINCSDLHFSVLKSKTKVCINGAYKKSLTNLNFFFCRPTVAERSKASIMCTAKLKCCFKLTIKMDGCH